MERKEQIELLNNYIKNPNMLKHCYARTSLCYQVLPDVTKFHLNIKHL